MTQFILGALCGVSFIGIIGGIWVIHLLQSFWPR